MFSSPMLSGDCAARGATKDVQAVLCYINATSKLDPPGPTTPPLTFEVPSTGTIGASAGGRTSLCRGGGPVRDTAFCTAVNPLVTPSPATKLAETGGRAQPAARRHLLQKTPWIALLADLVSPPKVASGWQEHPLSPSPQLVTRFCGAAFFVFAA